MYKLPAQGFLSSLWKIEKGGLGKLPWPTWYKILPKNTNRNKTQKATELGWSWAGLKPWVQFPAVCKFGDT